MTKEVLSQKEKELIAVGGSIAAGCVKCSHYHFRQAFEQGASQDEVAVNNVANTRRHIEAANRLGASSVEIHLAIKLAKVIQNRAGEFVDEEIEEFTAEPVAEN